VAGLTGSRRRGAVCGGLIALLVVWAAAARSTPTSDEALELRYRFSWAGVPIAVFGLRHSADAKIYQTELAIETTGLADQLFTYRALALATGVFEQPDGLTASRFRSAYTSHKKSRRIVIRFDPNTGDVLHLDITKRGEPDRSKVPASLQKGVTDPLTALMKLRHRLPDMPNVGTGPYTDAIFDGRRRFDLEARVLGRGREEIGGRSLPVIRVEVGLKWLAGSNADDLEAAEAGDDRLRLELLLSDDERRLPLRLRTLDSLFTAQAEVMPECLGPQGCPAVSG
jgi:Protein of unknown function (DUF3108)